MTSYDDNSLYKLVNICTAMSSFCFTPKLHNKTIQGKLILNTEIYAILLNDKYDDHKVNTVTI